VCRLSRLEFAQWGKQFVPLPRLKAYLTLASLPFFISLIVASLTYKEKKESKEQKFLVASQDDSTSCGNEACIAQRPRSFSTQSCRCLVDTLTRTLDLVTDNGDAETTAQERSMLPPFCKGVGAQTRY
jgi:hypothetical protein